MVALLNRSKRELQARQTVAFLGGDRREVMVMQALLEQGYAVRVFARPPQLLPAEARFCESAAEALAGAAAVVLPMPPLSAAGKLYNIEQEEVHVLAEDFAVLAAGTPVLAGFASPFLHYLASRYQLRLIETADLEEIAAPSAVATAEGAIAEAILLSDDILCGQRALILGYGRIGKALAERLEGLRMKVMVTNRPGARWQQAEADGRQTFPFDEWPLCAMTSAYIFNTAPAPLLTEQVLEQLQPQTAIIDLAARPGGTDFAAAERLSIKAVLASGLPGKYAPRFGGEILAKEYPRLIAAALTAGKEEAE